MRRSPAGRRPWFASAVLASVALTGLALAAAEDPTELCLVDVSRPLR